MATSSTPSFDASFLASLATTSSKIRYLDKCGLSRGAIAKLLNKRYQHVRNVLLEANKKPANDPIAPMIAADLNVGTKAKI